MHYKKHLGAFEVILQDDGVQFDADIGHTYRVHRPGQTDAISATAGSGYRPLSRLFNGPPNDYERLMKMMQQAPETEVCIIPDNHPILLITPKPQNPASFEGKAVAALTEDLLSAADSVGAESLRFTQFSMRFGKVQQAHLKMFFNHLDAISEKHAVKKIVIDLSSRSAFDLASSILSEVATRPLLTVAREREEEFSSYMLGPFVESLRMFKFQAVDELRAQIFPGLEGQVFLSEESYSEQLLSRVSPVDRTKFAVGFFTVVLFDQAVHAHFTSLHSGYELISNAPKFGWVGLGPHFVNPARALEYAMEAGLVDQANLTQWFPAAAAFARSRLDSYVAERIPDLSATKVVTALLNDPDIAPNALLSLYISELKAVL